MEEIKDPRVATLSLILAADLLLVSSNDELRVRRRGALDCKLSGVSGKSGD